MHRVKIVCILVAAAFQFACAHRAPETRAQAEVRLNKQIIESRSVGKRDASHAMNLNDLGEIYRRGRRFSEAETLLSEAVNLRKELLGETHPDYAISLDNLGVLYTDTGRPNNALDLHRRALQVFSAGGPKYAIDVAICLNNLGYAEKESNNYSEARVQYEKALAEFDKLVQRGAILPNHESRRTVIVRLAETYQALGLAEHAAKIRGR